MKKEILRHVLKKMEQKNIPLTKITIQKIVFFLKNINIPIKYRFEPYLYGPYSSELQAELSYMELWDEVIYDNKSGYETIGEIQLEPIDYEQKISDKLDGFQEAVDDNFSFNSMEKAGTVIYCIKALEGADREVSENSVLEQFKNWKGIKYSDKEIKEAFHKIQPLVAS